MGKLRILCCGDRNWKDRILIMQHIIMASGFTFDVTIIEGEADGADTISKEVAITMGMAVEGFKADWKQYGKAAGPIRNQKMLDKGKPDIVLAFHDDLEHSKGTKDMVRRAELANIPVTVISHEGGHEEKTALVTGT